MLWIKGLLFFVLGRIGFVSDDDKLIIHTGHVSIPEFNHQEVVHSYSITPCACHRNDEVWHECAY